MRRLSRKLRQLASGVLELPQDVVFDLPRMTMIGDRQLHIENHRGIVHFAPDLLRLALAEGQLEVTGSELVVRTVWTEEIVIEGRISGIRLLK